MGSLVLVQTDQLYIKVFSLAFRLHIKNKVNFVVMVQYAYYRNHYTLSYCTVITG